MFPSSNFRKRGFQPLRYRISNGRWKVFLFLKKWDLPTLASCNCNLAMYQNLLHHFSSDNLHVLWMNAHLPPIHNTLIDIYQISKIVWFIPSVVCFSNWGNYPKTMVLSFEHGQHWMFFLGAPGSHDDPENPRSEGLPKPRPWQFQSRTALSSV